MKKNVLFMLIVFFLNACGNHRFVTEDYVDLERFITKWYVIAGRFTPFENGAYNPVENYSWVQNREYIQVDFSFNKNKLDGELKRIPQKAWVYNTKTNAHWKISPFWPLKLNYLILAVADDYSWTAVGVPNQKYLWIMAKNKNVNANVIEEIIKKLNAIGYSTSNLTYAKHNI